MNSGYKNTSDFSKAKLDELRNCLENANLDSDDIVLTCGSFARREASKSSDLDFFVLTNDASKTDNSSLADEIYRKLSKVVPTEPAIDGAFSNVDHQDNMIVNIGGENDSNHNITRRMLFLLEGEWLFNRNGFEKVRRNILERYIGPGMTDHQLALFLLNDIIRFYRTMAVDYEFKINEKENPKPWGIRNIKLVFSRKLLYASGLFSVALTADRGREEKISKLEELFDLPVIDRMKKICGESEMSGVLSSYDIFLDRLADPDVRKELQKLKPDDHKDCLFRELKNEGHHFSRELLKLFERTFDSTHPIRRAVIL